MSILDTVLGHGRHRLTPAELRQENRLLLAREIAAGDFFALLIRDRDEVHACWLKAAVDRDTAEQLADEYAQQLAKQDAELRSLRAQLAPYLAAEANAHAIDVPPMVRDTSDSADQATAPIDVRPLWQALGIGPVTATPGSPNPAHVPQQRGA